jgi:hypothetical protein
MKLHKICEADFSARQNYEEFSEEEMKSPE